MIIQLTCKYRSNSAALEHRWQDWLLSQLAHVQELFSAISIFVQKILFRLASPLIPGFVLNDRSSHILGPSVATAKCSVGSFRSVAIVCRIVGFKSLHEAEHEVVPVVVLPMLGDQNDNAYLLTWLRSMAHWIRRNSFCQHDLANAIWLAGANESLMRTNIQHFWLWPARRLERKKWKWLEYTAKHGLFTILLHSTKASYAAFAILLLSPSTLFLRIAWELHGGLRNSSTITIHIGMVGLQFTKHKVLT